MRKIVVCNISSLDGYYEDIDRNVMPIFDYRRVEYPTDESFDEHNLEMLRASDTLLLGKNTYAMFQGYWPHIVEDPDPTDIVRGIGERINAIDKVVVSDTLKADLVDSWANTSILGKGVATAKIAEMKRGKGKDIVIFGSRSLWNSLLTEKLIDELHLMIAPVIIHRGIPVFSGKPNISLRLLECRKWENSGNLLVRYAIVYP